MKIIPNTSKKKSSKASIFLGLLLILILSINMMGCSNSATSNAAESETKSDSVVLSVASNDIYGTADSSGYSTIKSDTGTEVTYTGSAQLQLTSENGSIDDSLIDSSNATVSLSDGDGYYPEDYIFQANSLSTDWSDGMIEYSLNTGDIEPDNSEYSVGNGGREWSCLGGDGGGNYYFNLTISGITYDGNMVPDTVLRVQVYIYGRDFTA